MAPTSNERLARNENLQLLMERVGWRPETLARKVNLVLAGTREKRRVHEKTPYRWLNRGEVPHAPVPDVVAYLLSRAIGEPVAFDQVWPAGTRPCATWVWAAEGRDVRDIPWDHQGLLQLLGEWSHTMLTRRRCLVLSGAALTEAAWQWLDAPAPIPVLRGDGNQVTFETLSLIDTIVAGAQSLDEKHGSGAADFVASQFNAVARLLRRSSYDANTGQRLCNALGQLAQTSGWMAHEAAHDGQAQRWFLTGLRAAHSAGDNALAAGILALMSNQATTIGKSAEATQLAAAAQEAARGCSHTVQALVSARSCLAYADIGDSAGFHRSRDTAKELITRALEEGEQVPGWASYITLSELDAMQGRALVMLARALPGQRRSTLLAEAIGLLHDRAHDPSEDHQRSALRHGIWLSLAHTRAGNLDEAVAAGRAALRRLLSVTSAQCVALLGDLRDDLAPHAPRTTAVRDLVHDVERRLA